MKSEQNALEQHEISQLFEEFRSAWGHLGLLDNRRYHIFQYFSAFLGVSLGAAVASYRFLSSDPVLQVVMPALIFAIVFLTAITSVEVLKSERRATERYRNKINFIRKVLLEDCKHPAIRDLVQASNQAVATTGLNFEPVTPNNLAFSNIWLENTRSTALYIKLYIQILGWLALCGSLYFIGTIF